MVTATYYSMSHCAKCAGRKEITKAVCDSVGIEFIEKNIEDLRKKEEIEGLHLHNLPTLRLDNGKEIYGAYSKGDLELFLKKELQQELI